ncbi:MAG TPA: MBL fold metallo-hydrolase [Vicinamibacterales bacterium]|nr:MBL fold metallo-hydrolase [Vicinamibacterales bacterium]
MSCRLAAGFLFLALGPTSSGQTPAADWELVVLGIAQDAGIPHLNCQQELCTSIRAGRRRAEKVSSLGLVDRVSGRAYLFDATPDFSAQVHALTGGRPPDGIFLTHAHIGHYTGLMYLGRESIGARGVPVYATERMLAFLESNGPWSQLIALGNIERRPAEYDRTLTLPGGIRVTPVRVPHRDEFSDTVGYRIEGPRQSAIFIPDIDRWEKWDRSIRALADTVALAFLDGTFASPTEVNRNIEEIPHPMMSRTRELLKGARAKLWFIHINHTNAEIDAADVVREGMTFPM